MVSYVVAASVFVVGSSYLVQFVIEPPGTATANLEHLDQRLTSQHALGVLLETPGIPKAWGTSVPSLTRLGLIEPGTSIRLDPLKYESLARGKTDSSTASNGDVDYAEAKAALGLTNYDFHLRAYPVIDRNAADHGIRDMDDFRVAYVGSFTGETYGTQAQFEADALDNLDLTFTNATRTSNAAGDVFQQDSQIIRERLLPDIGATIQQDVISQGSGTAHDFYRVPASTYNALLTLNLTPPNPAPTQGMALSKDGYTLGYAKNREVRAIVGAVDTTGLSSATLVWAEWVDTGRENTTYDCGDYGFVEVSVDNGQTWDRRTDSALERSQDCNSPITKIHPANLSMRSLTLDSTCSCDNKANVLIAFHWVADNDNSIGYGWVVDNVRVTANTAGTLLLSKTFASAEYDMLVIGSDVTHNALVPADVKNGIRDFVDLYGGKLVVLGGDGQNTNWLDRLFDVGVGGSAPASSETDVGHPFLNIPNALAYKSYAKGTAWTFNGDHAGLFDLVVGDSPTQQHLSVSKNGTWGPDGGHAIVTSFEPHAWEKDEARRFFANAVLHGRYRYLNIDMGPTIPPSDDVASATRSATMNFRKDGGSDYGEIVFELHVWPGASTAQTLAAASKDASAPRSLTAGAADRQVWVNWTWPTTNGTGTPQSYKVYRSDSSDGALLATQELATIPVTGFNWTFHDYNYSAPDNGRTKWYTVRLLTETGVGAPATPVSATPYDIPGAPTSVVAAGGLGNITLTWTPPASTGPATILGYRIWVNDSPSTYAYSGEIGNGTFYSHANTSLWTHTFLVQALNGRGWGPNSSASNAAQPLIPASAPTLFNVTNLTLGKLDLTWAAPGSLGSGSLTGYKIHRSTDGSAYAQLVELVSQTNVSYEDFNVSGNTPYWYKIQAVTSVGDGSLSGAEVMRTKDPNQPAANPATFNATGAVPGHIALTWTPPASYGTGTLLGYRINRSTDNFQTTGSELVYLADPNNASFLDGNVVGGTYYWYRVRAITTVAQGFNSSTESDRSVFTLPSTPTGFAVSNASANKLALTWDDHAGDWGDPPVGSGFKIYRSTDGTSFAYLATTLTALNTSFDDATVADNTTYWYKIAATAAQGDSPQTSAASATSISPPWQTLGLQKTGSQALPPQITMGWTPPVSNGGSALTKYEIYRGTSAEDMLLYGQTADGATTSYTDALALAGPYYYKIRAVNAAGEGPFSSAVQMSV